MQKQEFVYVGKRVERPDAVGKVTGETQFVADMNQPHQLYAALVRSPYAYAEIKNIDYSEAAAMEGVAVVITGEDEHTGIGHYAAEMPTLAYKRVMYWGEPVVAIAAETLEIAKAACATVKVEYEVKKPVLTLEDSLKGDVVFHDWSKLNTHHELYFEQDTNICQHVKMGECEIFFRVVLPNTFPGIISGGVLAFARGLGEFGATAMIAGNIAGKTRTLPVAVYSEIAAGNTEGALGYVQVITIIAFAAVVILNVMEFYEGRKKGL